MGVVHFLNVGQGDCSIIQHSSGWVSVIDICNGNSSTLYKDNNIRFLVEESCGNHRQKDYPVNPIEYLKHLGIHEIWRFILTHPDMDHMSGFAKLFDDFDIYNFWDTENNKSLTSFKSNDDRKDWLQYQHARRGQNILHLYGGDKGQCYNRDEDGTGDGDCLQVLCPTPSLIEQANAIREYNNASYVILYNEGGRKILFSGDAGKDEWDVLLDNYWKELRNIDVLIAPHHGRRTGGNDDFLDILKPKLTLFGNASSKYLDYQSWNDRGLCHFTNNQGGTFVLEHNREAVKVYCTYDVFAKCKNRNSFYDERFNAWYIKSI